MRTLLLIPIAWLLHVTQPLFTVLTLEISSRTLILLGDGLFLIYKAIWEIHEELSPVQEDEYSSGSQQLSLCDIIAQIMLSDIVSSLDSVITAVSLSQHILIIITAIMIAVGVMMSVARTIGDFVNATPSIKILALTFSLFAGALLVAGSLSIHIAREYPCFAIFFSLSVGTLNIIRERRNKKASILIETHESYSRQ